MTIFQSFRSTVNGWVRGMRASEYHVLEDPATGAPVGLQSRRANGPQGIWAPTQLTSAQIASPTTAMVADLNATYQLNVAPYTLYRSNGTTLLELLSSTPVGPINIPIDGAFVINSNTGTPVLGGLPGTTFVIIGQDGAGSYSEIQSYGTDVSHLVGFHADGTESSMLPATNDKQFLRIMGEGWDGGDRGIGCFINLAASEDFTPTAHGGHIDFSTTTVGTQTKVTRMRIAEQITVGTTTASGTAKFRVVGGTSTDTLAVTGGVTGTFVCNGATPVTVTNANVTANSVIIVTLKTVGGTVGAVPAVKTITATTGFTIAGTAADTSTYNYVIVS